MKMVRISLNGKTYEYPEGTRYGEIAADMQKDYPHDIVLVSVNKRLRELNKKLYEDAAHKVQAKKADGEKAFKLRRLIVVAADKTYVPVALMAAGVVVTDGTIATTCTMAADEA